MPQNKFFQQVLLALCLVVSSSLIAGAKMRSLISPGDAMPTFRAEASEGGSFESPKNFEGKVTIFVLFGTWCPFCKRFFADIKPRLAEFKGRGIQVVALGQNHSLEELITFRDNNDWLGIQYLADPGARIQKLFATGSVPQIYIVDRRGKVIEHFSGYNASAWPKIEKQLIYAGQR